MTATRIDYTAGALGQWFLHRLLSAGALGSVLTAEPKAMPGQFAVAKLLHPHLTLDAEIERRFLDEVDASSGVHHANIIQVLEGGLTKDSVCYLVTVLLRGQSLDEVLKHGPLSTSRTLNLGQQIARALHAAHQLGIVHRDLKPGSVFVVPQSGDEEFVGLLDIGAASRQGAPWPSQHGAWLGSPAYLSPEQWNGLPDIDGRADIYALGIILYECLTGQHPFSGTTPAQWLTAHLEQRIPDPGELAPVSRAFGELIRRMMAKKREHRPGSMAEVLRELQACAERTEPATAKVIPSPVSQRAPRSDARQGGSWWRRYGSGLLIGSLLVAAVGGGTWLYLRRESPYQKVQPPPPTVATQPTVAPPPPTAPSPSAPPPAPPLPPEMVVLGPGQFQMGRGAAINDPEGPAFPVSVERFALARYEVSMADFRSFAMATQLSGSLPWEGVLDFDAIRNLPVNLVTRNQARSYCRWKYADWGGRLPTEAEWEYAARNGLSERWFPWVENKMMPERLNAGRRQPLLMAVDSLPEGATEQGLFHMLGNVAEWTDSLVEPYPGSEALIPAGAAVRGGGAATPLKGLSATSRASLPTTRRDPFVGFRCVAEPRE